MKRESAILAVLLTFPCMACVHAQDPMFDGSLDPDFGVNYYAMDYAERDHLRQTDYKVKLFSVIYDWGCGEFCGSRKEWEQWVLEVHREKPLNDFLHARLERYLTDGNKASPWMSISLMMLRVVEGEKGLPIVRRVVEKEWPHDRWEGADIREAMKYLLDFGDASDLARIEAAYVRSMKMQREFGNANCNHSWSAIESVYEDRDEIRPCEIESMRRMAAADTSDPEWKKVMEDTIRKMEKKLVGSAKPQDGAPSPPSVKAPAVRPTSPSPRSASSSDRDGRASEKPSQPSRGITKRDAVLMVAVAFIGAMVLYRLRSWRA